MYKWLSKIYDLIDVIYFKNNDRNPRKAVISKIPQGKIKVADICTGTATVLLKIADSRPEAEFFGIDRSSDMLKIAAEKVKERKNIKLKCSDACNTGIEDGTFDVVVISLVLHEIDEKTAENILAEAHRILKKNGKLIITEWETSKSMMQRFIFFPIKKLEPKGFKEFLQKDIITWIEKSGFNFADIKHCDYSKVLEFVSQ